MFRVPSVFLRVGGGAFEVGLNLRLAAGGFRGSGRVLVDYYHSNRASEAMSIQCPVCGNVLQPGTIPVTSNSAFLCHRCRTQLEVVPRERLPIFAISVGLSSTACVLLGLRGLTLVIAIAVFTAMIYWFVLALRTVVATPKLQRNHSGDKPLHQTRNANQI